MKSASLVLALGLALAPGALRADDVPVTLAEALALARQANPELQAAFARVDAQSARAEAVRRLRRPRLGLSMDWSRTDLPAGVFASKLNAGQFTPADFDLASLNQPGALTHLGTSLSPAPRPREGPPQGRRRFGAHRRAGDGDGRAGRGATGDRGRRGGGHCGCGAQARRGGDLR